MRRHRTPQRDDRGVVAIEFVLILPFLLMLIVGILVAGQRPQREGPGLEPSP